MGDFRYSALTPELLAMSQELEDLGGGDARIGKAHVCCVVAPTTPALSILQPVIGGLSVLDPREAGASKHPCKVFPVPAHIQGQVPDGQIGGLVGQAAAEWVLEGFSAALLAFGQSGTGKSLTLFGPQHSSTEPILPAVLHSLFNSCSSNSLRVGVSCWEIVQHELVDLLADSSHQLSTYQGGSLLTATEACRCVQAASASEALSLLHLAQSNSSNWTSDEHDGQQHQQKLAINKQLLSLSKVVSELSRLSTSSGSGVRQVTSARDTPLMQLVAPLIAGNARTFLLAAVSSHPNNYLETVNTLRIATRAQNIQTACMRTTGVRPDQVQMVSAAQVLAEERHRRLSAATTITIRQQEALASQANDDECQHSDPKELTWDGPLHAASGNVQAASGSGGLQDEPSFAFNRAVRPASAPETKAAPYSSLAAVPADDAAMPALVNKAAQRSDAGMNDFAAYTPQELADHLQQLKKEFREIYSSILDEDSHSPCRVAAEGVVPSDSDVHAVPVRLPITSKYCNVPVASPPPPCQSASCPPIQPSAQTAEAHAHAVPCIVPFCTAEQWPQLDMHALLQQHQADVTTEQHHSKAVCQQQPSRDVQQAREGPGLYTAAGVRRSTCSGLGQDTSPDTLHQAPAVLGASDPLGLDSDTLPAPSSRAFLGALHPRSPTERCSPGVAALAQRPMSVRDNSSRQQGVADLRINNEALLCMLERERQHSHQLEQRLQQVEADALERSLEQEVGLEEGRLAAISLRSKCRKLESESLFAEVFEKYEEEIRQLQDEAQLLKQSNSELSQQLASSDVLGPHPRSPLRQMPIPSQPAAMKGSAKGTALQASPSQLKLSGQQNSLGEGQAKAASLDRPAACEAELKCEMGQGEMRLQSLRKQLKRSAAQCEALKAEVAELKRRDRTADLYKKKANDGVRRVSELQKEVAHCKQERQSCQHTAHQAANNMADLQGNSKFLEAEHIQALAANQDLQASVQTLREQVRLLRTQRQRSVVLAHLPPLRPEAQPPLNGAPPKCTALDVARRLQLEPAQTPKVAALVERMAEETHMLSADRQTLQHREVILMELLTGHPPL
ncbi:hypothetical protein WJX82_005375 [Trebouxia sp. C0006]